MTTKRRNECAISIIETMAALLALVPIVVAVTGLAQYLIALRNVDLLADRYINSMASHPFELRNWDVYLLMRLRKDTPSDNFDNYSNIDEQINDTADALELDLKKIFALSQSTDDSKFRIELGWRYVPITTDSGLVNPIEVETYRDNSSAPAIRGSFLSWSGAGSSAYTASPLISDFDNFIEPYTPQDDGNGGHNFNVARFPYSIPSAIRDSYRGAQGTGSIPDPGMTEAKQSYDAGWTPNQDAWHREYLRMTLIWGLHLTVSLQGSLAGNFMEFLGKPPIVSRLMIAPSRSVF